jgi:hypothetical protein
MSQFILPIPGHWSDKYAGRPDIAESIMKDYQLTVPRALPALKKYDTAGNQATMISGSDAIVRALQGLYR